MYDYERNLKLNVGNKLFKEIQLAKNPKKSFNVKYLIVQNQGSAKFPIKGQKGNILGSASHSLFHNETAPIL